MRFTFPQSVGLRFEIQPQFVLKGVLTQAFFKKKERKKRRLVRVFASSSFQWSSWEKYGFKNADRECRFWIGIEQFIFLAVVEAQ